MNGSEFEKRLNQPISRAGKWGAAFVCFGVAWLGTYLVLSLVLGMAVSVFAPELAEQVIGPSRYMSASGVEWKPNRAHDVYQSCLLAASAVGGGVAFWWAYTHPHAGKCRV